MTMKPATVMKVPVAPSAERPVLVNEMRCCPGDSWLLRKVMQFWLYSWYASYVSTCCPSIDTSANPHALPRAPRTATCNHTRLVSSTLLFTGRGSSSPYNAWKLIIKL